VDEDFLLSDRNIDFGEARRQLGNAPCLSIRQPWAELILLQRKKVELRRWSTRHRGWVWLHTGKAFNETDGERFGLSSLFTGGFVGAFLLRDVVLLDAELWDAWQSVHLDHGERLGEVFGWVIGHPLRLAHPLPAPGSQGLYLPDPTLIERLRSQQFIGEM